MSLTKGKQLKDATITNDKLVNDTIEADKINETGVLSTINAGDAAVDGTAIGIARKDHQHAVSTAAPSTTLDLASTNAEGASSDLARSDHSHAIDPGLVGDIADIGTSTSAGTSDKVARADHIHKLGTNAVTSDSISSGASQAVLESKYEAWWNRISSFSANGTSDDVTTEVEGAASVTTERNAVTAGTGILSTGTSTGDSAGTATQNYKIRILYSDDVAESPDKKAIQKYDPVDDGDGNEIYGVLSKTASVWTLNYYKQDGTAYTFSSATNVEFVYAEVFSLFTKPGLAPLTDIAFGDLAGLDTHNHNDIYYTESEIGSATSSSGSDLVGDDDTYANFTPSATTVKAALEAIDGILAVDPGAHASRHITGGADVIDGDKLDITFTPSNYTPTTSPAEADDLDNLTAHLAGIDAALTVSTDTENQEEYTGETITGTDTDFTFTLTNEPKSAVSVKLFINGQAQRQGHDYQVNTPLSTKKLKWLGSTGVADFDIEADDILVVCYIS